MAAFQRVKMSWLRRVCGGLLWATVVCSAQQPAAQDPYARCLRAAAGETAQGNLSSAMADIQSALALKPAEAAGWYQLGLLQGQTGNSPAAEAAFRHAIVLQPGLAQAHYNLALTLIANPQNKEDWPGAIAECREALRLRPAYPEALNLLGAGLNNQGQPDAAIEALERAIQWAPALPEAHFNLGLALASKDRLDEAAKQYAAAVAAKREYPEASSALGKLLFRMGKPVEAERELKQALRLNPDLADAHYTLARIFQAQHENAQAEVEFAVTRDLGERQPNGILASQMSNQALQMAAKGDLAGAAATLQTAIALKPDYGVPHYNLGLILADMSETARAEHELTEAISLLPGEAGPWFELGRVLELTKDHQGALQAIAWAAHLAPSNETYRAELSRLQATRAMPAGSAALRALQPPGIGARSDTAAAHFDYAQELTRLGDFEGAIGELLRSLALHPAMQNARRDLAAAYANVGHRDRAELEYRKLLLAFPEDAEAHIALGELLLQQGNAREAAEQVQQALIYQPGSLEAQAVLKRADQRAHQR
jgi:tetratricopeptide (TPR) repeat protein